MAKQPKKKRVSFRLHPDRLARLSLLADRRRVSRNKLLEIILHDFTVEPKDQLIKTAKPPEKQITGFILPEDSLRGVARIARKHSLSRNSLVEMIIDDHLERELPGTAQETPDDRQVDLFA